MNRWTISVVRQAEKDLDALPQHDQDAVEVRLDQLAIDPFRTDIRKLQGTINEWRVRVGDYRILVELDAAARKVTVLRIRHRREAYR
ncbi:MAG: type II toxin-antitoxin system RelE family toxin [Dehalococcoidia bacterium]